MKRFIIASLLFGLLPAWAMAQDDMYFTPTKKEKKEVKEYSEPAQRPCCNRDVDEYNRRGKFRSQYSVIGTDSLADGVYDYSAGIPVDSMAYYGDDGIDFDDDYIYSRRLSRFDDFYWYSPWYYSWYGSPYWYGNPYWYARYGWGWYDPWYDPWYYGGWGYPYYWGWGGWHHHVHHPVVAYHPRGWRTGTNNRMVTGTSNRRFAQRNDTGRRTTRWNNNSYRNINRANSFGQNSVSRPSYSTGSFGGNRGSFSGGSRGGSFGGGGGGARSGGRR